MTQCEAVCAYGAFAVDVNWLRECAPGFPIGVRSVRVWTREELVRALTGTSEIEWLRALLADSCSLRWKETGELVGARPAQLDDLALYFRSLTASEEDALWQLSRTTAELQAVAAWVKETGAEFQYELDRRGASFWSSVEGRWLRAAAANDAERMAAMKHLAAFATRPDLAQILVALHGQAEREWSERAMWFRHRVAECGAPAVSEWLPRLAERIWTRATRMAHEGIVKVTLPVMDRRAWVMARESLGEATLVEIQHGALELRRERVEEPKSEPWSATRAAMERVLASTLGRRSEAPMDDLARLTFEQSMGECAMRALWERVMSAHGWEPSRVAKDATVALEIPLAWSEEWAEVPAKRETRYFERFHQLSLALQHAGRVWLPSLTLKNAESFAETQTAMAMLVYAASEPTADRRAVSYGYDALSPRDVERCAQSALRRLPELLSAVHAELLAQGRPEIAALYAPERARLIVTNVARQHRALAALVAADAYQLEQCFHLVDAAREAALWERRNPARAMRKLMQAAAAMAKAEQKAARRVPALEQLGALYLVEATRVIAQGVRAGECAAHLHSAKKECAERMAA